LQVAVKCGQETTLLLIPASLPVLHIVSMTLSFKKVIDQLSIPLVILQ